MTFRQFQHMPLAQRASMTMALLLAICTLSTPSFADSLMSGEDEEFLRVEDAYQVMVELTDNQVEMSWTLAPGYYLYQHQFKLEANNGSEIERQDLKFKTGKRKFDEYFNKELEVYYYNTFVSSNLPSMPPPYELKITSQGCADAGLCYPPRKQFFHIAANGEIKELGASEISTRTATPAKNLIEPTGSTSPKGLAFSPTEAPENTPFLPIILLFALTGGLILNLMPCVFPVLSLKALSFASSNQEGHQQHLHGWAYTIGVVGSFVAAAAVILSAREAGEMLGWGFQLQHPVFVALLAYLFLVMALGLYGMFSFGTQFMGAGQSLTAGTGIKASFFTGVLAAVVASPCTAPFMASALGAALTQPVSIALLIFATLGLGMALPFLALSYSPQLANFLPKPGAWMETLKQALAFPLLATSIWLLWVLGNQTGSDGTALVLAGGLLICFALWLLRFSPTRTASKAILSALIITSLLAAAHFTWKIRNFKANSEADTYAQWETFTYDGLEALRAQGRPVFINLTADWCITCKLNEQVAFSSQTFFNYAQEQDVVLMIGDWTNPNDDIAKLLKQYKRSGIPLYMMFPARKNAPPEILPQILTTGDVTEAIDRAFQ